MVLICGLEVEINSLPYADAIEYVKKVHEVDMRMLGKTKLLAQSTEIYATYDVVDYIPSTCRCKTFLVRDEKELREKLLRQPQSDYMEQLKTEGLPPPNTNKTAESVHSEESADYDDFPVSNDDFEQLLQEKDNELRYRDSLIGKLQTVVKEQSDELASLRKGISNDLAADTDTLLAKIAEMETLLSEKDVALQEQAADLSSIAELPAELEREKALRQELSDTADKRRLEIERLNTELENVQHSLSQLRHDYESKIERDKRIFEKETARLQEAAGTSALADKIAPFLHTGGKQPEIPSFTESELERLQKLPLDNISLLCFGSGNSQFEGLRSIQNMLTRGEDLLLADCTGDIWLPSVLKLECRAGIILNPCGNISDMVIRRGKTKIIRTNAYNDLLLYGYDWIPTLEKLSSYANGTKTYILFGSLRNFAVKYTVLRLAQVIDTTLLVKADPYCIQSLHWDLMGVPADRLTLGVFEYTTVVKQILDNFVTKYNIRITKSKDISEILRKPEQ